MELDHLRLLALLTLTAALHEKERVIQQQTEQLRKLEKTATGVAKIAVHSRQQSELIATLKTDLIKGQVCISTTCIFM